MCQWLWIVFQPVLAGVNLCVSMVMDCVSASIGCCQSMCVNGYGLCFSLFGWLSMYVCQWIVFSLAGCQPMRIDGLCSASLAGCQPMRVERIVFSCQFGWLSTYTY